MSAPLSEERPAMPRKRASAVRRLMVAMDRCAIVRAEAQWTNGYRAAKEAFDLGTKTAEHERLHAKELQQWEIVARADHAFRKLAQRVVREVSNV